jgi:hypothetical protein
MTNLKTATVLIFGTRKGKLKEREGIMAEHFYLELRIGWRTSSCFVNQKN